ncbi:MAG: hypothetical protein HOW97_03955 [Catenulispora sp.]|nr:hypothetical protein [Catenulispora sp.]
MNRRRIAIGVSSVSGLAVVAVSAVNLFSGGGKANAVVDLHAAPVAAVSAAGTATGRTGSAQIDTLVTMSTAAVPAQGAHPARPAESTTMHGTGAFDFAKQMGTLDVAVAGGSVQEVLTSPALYMRTTSAPNAATSAKGWQKVDAAKSSDGNLVSGGATDPALVLAMLAGTRPGVQFVGQDQVRGVPVAHYRGTLDLQQAAQAADPAGVRPADAAVARRALATAARAFTSSQVPFDAYLDEQGRLRRFVGLFSFTLPGSAKTVVQVTSATELFGFGTPVTVTVPAVAPPAAATPGHSPHTAPSAPPAHPSSPTSTHK